ncbi:hypothetical protein DTO164E3_4066 [Paecilomyces variotii]|nr:hypothetical protein DTO164E3_4066 [Paecilomyces variotii]KAJ9208295.1 hypothetical protein DTO032I3_966 [Paecilomyces variotii]KAJ9282252.1 hypothetical protein DTO021D3_1004 [Paecilomyces variotii]KAJ9305550.1 hypothetical protein DTO217A2_4949 [Paecilomyces variotii]KAJ9343689.1 hypothetical protein DTO027B6_3907 [Paecilomyces variotii]
MTSYFASLTSSSAISNLGTRFNSLRRAISSGDEVDDTENEDCSHISNVLRAYYIEKGRPFPGWLPPDPKAPAAPQPRMVATQAALQQGGYGQAQGRGAGLSDLWGDSTASQPPPQQQTLSLRRGRSQAPAGTHSLSTSPSPGSRPSTATPPPPMGARPLPSQRGASYQSTQSAPQGRLGLDRAGSGGSSASDRLRARLQGSFGGSSPSPPPAQSPGSGPMGSSRWGSTDSAASDSGYGSNPYAGGSAGSGAGSRRPVGLPSGPKLRGPR